MIITVPKTVGDVFILISNPGSKSFIIYLFELFCVLYSQNFFIINFCEVQQKGEIFQMSTKQFKNEKIEHYKKQFENAKVAVVADYRGLTVEEITELRRGLQAAQSDLTVTKNTLCKVAAKGTNFEAISELMTGPTAIAFGFGDEVASAKVLAKFIKENKKGEILGAVLENKVLTADEAKKLASMPGKEELYAKMLGSINSPASGLVYSINGVMSALVRAIDAVAKQKA